MYTRGQAYNHSECEESVEILKIKNKKENKRVCTFSLRSRTRSHDTLLVPFLRRGNSHIVPRSGTTTSPSRRSVQHYLLFMSVRQMNAGRNVHTNMLTDLRVQQRTCTSQLLLISLFQHWHVFWTVALCCFIFCMRFYLCYLFRFAFHDFIMCICESVITEVTIPPPINASFSAPTSNQQIVCSKSVVCTCFVLVVVLFTLSMFRHSFSFPSTDP